MLKNYFKIAIAVLRRRKFFTFISLFGISFTLTILMFTTALVDKMIKPGYPDYKRARSLYISKVILLNSKEGWYNGSSASFHLLDQYVSKLKVPEMVGIYTFPNRTNAYVGNKKLALEYKYTNVAYWDIAEYEFLEGSPYTARELEHADHVAVISESTRDHYFGEGRNAVGKYIEIDNVSYRVKGVVRNVSHSNRNFFADLYLPYTVSKSGFRLRDAGSQSAYDRFMGNFGAVLLAKSEGDLSRMRSEYKQMIAKIDIGDKEYTELYVNADTVFEALCRNLLGNEKNSAIGKTVAVLGLVIILFLLLPTINLVNINITRIIERSSEIGVRKAFGASSKTLVYQFIVENMVLTLIGGIIGVLLSSMAIYLFNRSNLLPDTNLVINFTVLWVGLLICLIFGLISGVYPAWRMSRLNVVRALKAQ